MEKSSTKYNERLKRVEDAIALKIPDRVPFFPQSNFLAIKYTGISGEDAFYDSEKWFDSNKIMNLDLEPDMYWPPVAAYPGRSFDILDCNQIKWPGHGVPVNSSIQYVDREYMKSDEIDLFINDPTDYLISIYLPRVFGSLSPLKQLPSIKTLFYQGYKGALTSAAFTSPEVVKAFNAIYKAGLESAKYFSTMTEYERAMKDIGFVQAFSMLTVWCPFDVLGDMHRGIRGIMMDMFRQPDKLLKAMDTVQPMVIQAAENIANTSGNKRVFMPLHLGADGFMSIEQFERFYWPGLKKTILALIDRGLTPCPFFEGDYTSRLEFLTELPKGKIMGIFDHTNLFKAKEIIGDTMCIVGNMPPTLLQIGPPDDIVKYSKKLIDGVGKGGGFIMSSSCVLDDANIDYVKLWAMVTKEYGTY